MHSHAPRVPQSKKKLIELPAEVWRAPNNSRIHERDLGCALAVRCRIPSPNHVFIWTGDPAANCGLQFAAGFPLQSKVFMWSVNPAANCSLQFAAGFPLQIKCSFGVGILQRTGSEQAKPGIRLRYLFKMHVDFLMWHNKLGFVAKTCPGGLGWAGLGWAGQGWDRLGRRGRH